MHGWRRFWLERWTSLLRWMPLPVIMEEGTCWWGRWLQLWPQSLHITHQWLLASMVVQAFSANISSGGAPYSCPFRLSLHSQQLSRPWVCPPNPTSQHPAPLHTSRHTRRHTRVCRASAQTMCADFTLSCLPQTGCCIPL